MKKALLTTLLISTLLLSGCSILKKSDSSCSLCGEENAYEYKIDHVGKKVLEEKITVIYCESCYQNYLEKTFGSGAKEIAEEEYAEFKDIVGAGGYIEELQK